MKTKTIPKVKITENQQMIRKINFTSLHQDLASLSRKRKFLFDCVRLSDFFVSLIMLDCWTWPNSSLEFSLMKFDWLVLKVCLILFDWLYQEVTGLKKFCTKLNYHSTPPLKSYGQQIEKNVWLQRQQRLIRVELDTNNRLLHLY